MGKAASLTCSPETLEDEPPQGNHALFLKLCLYGYNRLLFKAMLISDEIVEAEEADKTDKAEEQQPEDESHEGTMRLLLKAFY